MGTDAFLNIGLFERGQFMLDPSWVMYFSLSAKPGVRDYAAIQEAAKLPDLLGGMAVELQLGDRAVRFEQNTDLAQLRLALKCSAPGEIVGPCVRADEPQAA